MKDSTFSHYYRLAKPGIVYGNALPVIAGFVFAAKGVVRFPLFLATLVGMSLVIASACVYNNYIDRDIDAKMRRTKHRAVASGRISGPASLAYGTILGALGVATLAFGANLLTVAVAGVGFFFYVVMYSVWKRRSTWGTAVGSIAGAVPPVAGYAAASGRIDTAALLLFAAMVAWQMPHFFAIAIRHADDYVAAGIPAVPIVRGLRAAKWQIVLYVLAFIAFSSSLALYGYAGAGYLAATLALGLAWLALCMQGFRIPEKDPKNEDWARNVFFFSLVVMVGWCVALTFSAAV